MKRAVYIIYAVLVAHLLGAQDSALVFKKQIEVDPLLYDIQDAAAFLKHLEQEHNFVFSYNANLLDISKPIANGIYKGDVFQLVKAIFPDVSLYISSLPPNKVVIQYKDKKKQTYRLSGTVKDQDTGEPIISAVIVDKHSNVSAITSSNGYYFMNIPEGNVLLEVGYIGYSKTSIPLKVDKNLVKDIFIQNQNYIDTIYIDDPKSTFHLIDGGMMINIFNAKEYKSITGETDIINNAKVTPGVNSGGEGQSGLFVQGGTPDQNLILMEGVALYETSHAGGISSIFLAEGVQDATIIKGGFPARYGGRLASVVEVQLKEGNRNKHEKSFNIGVPGAKAHFNGFVGNKDTYSISARMSWVNLYLDNLLRRFTKYQDINLVYHDVMAKWTHRFSNTSSLSLTYYRGGDRLRLNKTTEDLINNFNFVANEKNSIFWSNQLVSLKYNQLLSEKWALKMQAGLLSYSNGSRSTNLYNTTFQDSTTQIALDVLTASQIIDFNTRVDVDFHYSENHIFRAGVNLIAHKFNPSVRQSTFVLSNTETNILDRDSVIDATHIQMYIEDNYKINTQLFLYAGLHFSLYSHESKNYAALQPRLKFIWTPFSKHLLSAAYCHMSQPIHFLANNGLGLPTNLWVGSTANIAPQQGIQWSLGYTFQLNKGLYFYLGYFDRQVKNAIEYTIPVDLFHFLVNNQPIITSFNTSKDWERNIARGKSNSSGWEFLAHKTLDKIKGWASISNVRTIQEFFEINDGKPYPANHDKPWDVSLGISFLLNKNWGFGANFVYNTGAPFSLATEEYESFLGLRILNNDIKNNYRLPDFHQLSVNASYFKKLSGFDVMFNLNIYNVYNRLNAYFIYIYENNEPPYNRYIRKVSILPITPTFNINVSF